MTPEMNESLIRPVTTKEVKEVIFLSSHQVHLDLMGRHVILSKLLGCDKFSGYLRGAKFFRNGSFPKEWNHTRICLIPRKTNSIAIADLRPISLCSVLYNIISTILVSIIQPLLSHIVSPNQSAFVAEILISYNILVAPELVHALRNDSNISMDYITIKSDMSKAYDRVEWIFLMLFLGL